MPIVLPKEPKSLPDQSENKAAAPAPVLKAPTRRYARFGPPPSDLAVTTPPVAVPVSTGKPKREKKPTLKNDPKHVAAARELRDRYMEQFNANAGALGGASQGKYDVSKSLPAAPAAAVEGLPKLLTRAA